MTAGKNPWGDNGGDTDEAQRPVPSAHDSVPPEDAAPTAAKPHNPWLTPDDDSPLRRSARIDDILRPASSRRPSFRTSILASALGASGLLPWVLAASVAAGLLVTSIHVLDDNQRGVVSTLGRHSRDVGPGVAFTLPWPAETVQIFDVGTIQVMGLPDKNGAEALMPTRDGQLINIAFQVRWKIADAGAYAFALADPQSVLRDLAEGEMRATIAEMPFDPVWDGKRRKEVTERVQQRMQAALNAWHAGIRIEAVEITRADPPGQLTESFQKVTTAEGEAAKATSTAEDWAARTLNNARVEAQDFDRVYQQYLAAPEITRKRMYYETMERVIGNSEQVVIGGNGGVTLPARPGSAPAAPAAPDPAAPPAPQAKEGQ